MASLSGNAIGHTYPSLLKTSDNSGLTNYDQISDGAGVNSALWLGTDRVGVGIIPSTTLHIGGTTPTLRIGDGQAEDTAIQFDGHAQDYYIALDDTDDSLKIGLGTTVDTNVYFDINPSGQIKMPGGDVTIYKSGAPSTIDLGLTGNAYDTKILLRTASETWHVGADDSATKLIIGKGTAVGTTPAIAIVYSSLATTLYGDTTVDSILSVNGALTVSSGGLTVSSGGLTVSSGNLNVSSGNVIIGGSGYLTEAGRTIITILPNQFMTNDDVTYQGRGLSFSDGVSPYGVFCHLSGSELFTFVHIPVGYTATKVRIYGADTAVEVEVYGFDVTDGTLDQNGGGDLEYSNSSLTVGDDTALATNFVGANNKALMIKVVTLETSNDRVYGGSVTIQPT